MIAEIATAAALSGAAIGYMIGRTGKATMRASYDIRILKLEQLRDEWKESSQQMTKSYFSIKGQLDAIKRQRSDNTRRGNATRKAKREAAALIVRERVSG